MTCIPFKILCFKDINRLSFPYMSWQPVSGIRRGKLKTISINLEVWTRCQIQLSFVWMSCDPSTNIMNKLIHFCHVLWCKTFEGFVCYRDFLYWTLSVRGIHPNFFKSGLVWVLVGRSYIILAALYCRLKSRSSWALPQIQLQ